MLLLKNFKKHRRWSRKWSSQIDETFFKRISQSKCNIYIYT